MVARMPGVPESTTVLVRGAPGAGKTVFGSQLARAVARTLGGDVAYGCIELLPIEFQAQYAGLHEEGAAEDVVIPPFNPGSRSEQKASRFFAGLLDLGASGGEQARLGPAVRALLNQVGQAGGRPRVLVIDSLSDGYNLGGSTPRQFADALCKLAVELGLVLILLEEVVDSRPSVWSFAVDVVLELRISEGTPAATAPTSFDRWLTVSKNRFGPSDAGPHRFHIFSDGHFRVFPRPAVYLASWAHSILWGNWMVPAPKGQRWTIPEQHVLKAPPWPDFRDCVTTVYGAYAHIVFRVANQLGRQVQGEQQVNAVRIMIDFGVQPQSQREFPRNRQDMVVNAADPYAVNGHTLVAAVRSILQRIRDDHAAVEKALIGDLRSLRSFQNPEEIRMAIAVVVAMLSQVHIPTVLFETVTPRAGEAEPESVDFADTVISIPAASFVPIPVTITDTRTGLRHTWSEDL